MEHVADDRHVKAREATKRLAHRVEVEQRLRRMLVLSVSGVDDVGVRHVRDELGRTDVRMADHDHIGVVLGKRQRSVLQRLALVDGRARRAKRHRVGREALRRQVEAREGSGRRLVEQIDHESAAKRGQLLDLAVERSCDRGGSPEEAVDGVSVEIGDPEQMTARRRRVTLACDAQWCGRELSHRRPRRAGRGPVRRSRPAPR